MFTENTLQATLGSVCYGKCSLWRNVWCYKRLEILARHRKLKSSEKNCFEFLTAYETKKITLFSDTRNMYFIYGVALKRTCLEFDNTFLYANVAHAFVRK